MKVWIEGRVVDGEDARIPVTDHGLLYGDGVFEGIRVYHGRVFRLARHLARLVTSARTIALALPWSKDEIADVVLETARAFGEREAYVRLIVTRGSGALGVDPTTCHEPRLVCMVSSIQLFPPEKRAAGLALVTASVRRPPPDVLDPRVKSLNYLNSVLAKREARAQGADEALLLNQRGTIAEASVANVFVVRDGAIATPPATDGALEGITRGAVFDLARELGIPASERTLSRPDLFGADEAFLTGTGARIVPIRSLDGAELPGHGIGPVTERLERAFTELTRHDGVAVWPEAAAGPVDAPLDEPSGRAGTVHG